MSCISLSLVLTRSLYQVSLKRFTEIESKIIFLQMVEGLQYLHGRNIAHRDLKPENYLVVSKNSNVHILMADFGLARLHAGDMKTLCGTPQVSLDVCGFFKMDNADWLP